MSLSTNHACSVNQDFCVSQYAYAYVYATVHAVPKPGVCLCSPPMACCRSQQVVELVLGMPLEEQYVLLCLPAMGQQHVLVPEHDGEQMAVHVCGRMM